MAARSSCSEAAARGGAIPSNFTSCVLSFSAAKRVRIPVTGSKELGVRNNCPRGVYNLTCLPNCVNLHTIEALP